jgi:hypothetical protein
MMLGCPKVIPGKGMRAIVMAASALTRCSPVRLGALGQVRTPDHARRLKGEDAEHKPVHDRLHGSYTPVRSCIYLSWAACRQQDHWEPGNRHAPIFADSLGLAGTAGQTGGISTNWPGSACL